MSVQTKVRSEAKANSEPAVVVHAGFVHLMDAVILGHESSHACKASKSAEPGKIRTQTGGC